MAGYSDTPLWKKLGYRHGIMAYAESVPAGYIASLGLPSDVVPEWGLRVGRDTKLIHLFVTSRVSLAKRLKSLRTTIPADGAVWVSWPKKASGVTTDVTENHIREVALPLGFVDIKVCAVDEIWSGLKLMIRSELR